LNAVNTGPNQHDERGKKQDNHDDLGYDYYHAISEATRLWNELKLRHAQRGWKYPPNEASFNHLLSAWTVHPGKSLVHLFDLPDFVHVKLDSNGIGLLKQQWPRLVTKYSFREAFEQFGAVYHTVVGHHQSISVRALKKLSTETNLNLEQMLTATRIGANGKPVNFSWPMRIDNEPFAALFGFYGDLMLRHAVLVTKDKEVQKYFMGTVHSALGKLGISSWRSGRYAVTYATSFIRHLLTVGGLDTNVRQLEADNPIPLFLFQSSLRVVKSNLKSLFETEGGVSRNKNKKGPSSVDLHQAVLCNPPAPDKVPRHPGRVSFRRLGSPSRLLDSPPRLLTATSLLLLRFNIASRLWPVDLYKNDLNESVMRWRLMITGPDIELYRRQIGFVTTRKMNQLQHYP